MDSLPVPQQETVNEFVAITDLPADEEHLAKAIALLTHHDFNLNNAVLAFFERGLDLPTPAPEQDPAPEFIQSLQPFALGVDRFEGAAVHRNLQNEFVMNHLFPKLMKASRIPNRWIADMAAYRAQRELSEKKELSEKQHAAASPKKTPVWWLVLLIIPKTLTLILAALRYIFRFDGPTYNSLPAKFDYTKYDESYALVEDINDNDSLAQFDIATLNFNESHEHCQKEYSFLLTVLVDNNSVEMMRMLLKNLTFQELFNKTSGEFKDCRIYLANVDQSPEALEVAQMYRYRKLPYIFAAANVSRDPGVMSSMSLIYKANCYFGDDEERALLVTKVLKAVKRSFSEYSPQLVSKRYDKQEMEFSRLLKEKQDEAYLESLESDKIKKQEKELKKEAEACKAELASRKLAYLKHLIQCEHFTEKAAEATASNSVRVALKLPDGKRIIQKFLKDSSICEVYLFAELQMLEGELEAEAREIDYEDYMDNISFSFQLFRPVPKCILPISLTSIEEFGELKSGDTVLLEFNDESDTE